MNRVIPWVTFAILSIAVALIGSATLADINFRLCTLIMISVSWNMMAGAGLISLGHAAFWGLGAYAAILSANNFNVGLGVSLLPAIAVGGGAGALLAVITGRLKGIYFAIATLAMAEGLRVLAIMLDGFTGGSSGLYLNAQLFPGMTAVNVSASLAAIGSALISLWISRSRYSFALRAMRDNEASSQMLGVEPMKCRLGITAVSGATASLAGALSVWRGGYLDPSVAYDLHTTILAQIAPLLGGVYTVSGPIIGSIATLALSEITRLTLGNIVGASQLIFGLALVIFILLLPRGLNSVTFRQRRERNDKRMTTDEKVVRR